MSERSNSKSRPAVPGEAAGILAGLPNTRPQRASPRRVKASPKPAAKVPTANSGKPRATKTGTAPACAPRQGFEAGGEVERGLTVGPPNTIELATSVVGLLGEVAQAGVSSGGRLLKRAFARLGGH